MDSKIGILILYVKGQVDGHRQCMILTLLMFQVLPMSLPVSLPSSPPPFLDSKMRKGKKSPEKTSLLVA